MYAKCVRCPMSFEADSADDVESWATQHETLGEKHFVKVDGYEHVSASHHP